MTDIEWAQLAAALGAVRDFPVRETGTNAPGDPVSWGAFYRFTAQMAGEAATSDPPKGDKLSYLISLAQRALCCLAEERHFVQRVVAGIRRDEGAIQQALGKALGYPVAGPEVGGDGYTVVADPHVAATIALEAADELVNRATRVRQLEAELARWRSWHEGDRDAKLARPPSRNVVIAFEGANLGDIEEDIQGRVGQPAPPDYATRGIGQPVGVALTATVQHPSEDYPSSESCWYGALVTYETTVWVAPNPDEAAAAAGKPETVEPAPERATTGDPELDAAPPGSYRDRFTDRVVTPDDPEFVPF